MDRMGRVEGVGLDPLTGTRDASKPLLGKLLAVPAYKARYLGLVPDIATRWLDWSKLGPIAEQHHGLIADEVKADTRKLESFAAFESSLKGGNGASDDNDDRRRERISIRQFCEQRRAYLLGLPAVASAELPAKAK